jgi:SNF2 family DNA or RNA helicase
MIDNYWDTPEYTQQSLQRLQKERDTLTLHNSIDEMSVQSLWAKEQELRKQLQELTNSRNELALSVKNRKQGIAKLSTLEITFADQMRREAELASLEGRITALEAELSVIAQESPSWSRQLPFQREDTLYTVNAWRIGLTGVLNANDMGLGKTFEVATFDFLARRLFEQENNTTPSRIWVTKVSLVNATCREIKKWYPETMVIPLIGSTAAQKSAVYETVKNMDAIIVCNYEALESVPALIERPWNFIYMDEVHRLKGGANSKPTQVWVNAKTLVFNSRNSCKSFFLPMSGSPIQNHPKDMWAYLHIFDPIKFASLREFERTYCAWVGTGIVVNPEILIKAIKAQVIRRTMPEVRDQLSKVLGDVIYNVRELDMTPAQRKVYDGMKNDFFVWLDSEETEVLTATAIIAQLNRLRQIALWPDTILNRPVGSAKIDEAMDIIEELTSAGEQVVVFSAQFNDPLQEIQKRCESFYDITCETITGANKDVDATCERFRQGNTKVLCINSKSGGEGLNLQKSEAWPGGACHVIMLDLWWNPKSNEQAIARVYRTGQTDIVQVHVLKAIQSVDYFIDSILDDKTVMIDSVMTVKELRKSKNDWKNSLSELI